MRLVFFIVSNVEAEDRFPQVEGLTVVYKSNKDKVKATWQAVSDAQKYKIKVMNASNELVKKKTVDKTKKKFKGKLFANGATYTFKVKAKKTDSKKGSKWTIVSYTHGQTGAAPMESALSYTSGTGRSGAYYLPQGYDLEAKPLMLVYHGTGGNGQGMLDAFQSLAEEHGFIIVAPDSGTDASVWYVNAAGAPCTDITHVENCLNEVLALPNVTVDSNHALAVGYSGGGQPALNFSSQKDMFTHFAMLHMRLYVSNYDIVGTNAMSGWFSTGTTDPIQPPIAVGASAVYMTSIGFASSYHEYDTDHGMTSTEREELVDWWLS